MLNLSVMETKVKFLPRVLGFFLFYEHVPDHSLKHSKKKCLAMGRKSRLSFRSMIMMMMIKRKIPHCCLTVYTTLFHRDTVYSTRDFVF